MKFKHVYCFLLLVLGFVFASLANAHSVEHIVKASNGLTSPIEAKRIIASVRREAKAQSLSATLLFKIIHIESKFKRKARSPSGAVGLMQVIPRWHREKIRGRDMREIEVNVEVGARVVREYLDLCAGNLRCALRRYSGGGARYYAKIEAVKLAGSPESLEESWLVEPEVSLPMNAIAINLIPDILNH